MIQPMWPLLLSLAHADPDPEERRVLARTFDRDRDGALDRTELRDLARQAPDGHGALLRWCVGAVADPAANGVHFADDAHRARSTCDAQAVSAPYLTAWAGAPPNP